jgi:hypothetical protein
MFLDKAVKLLGVITMILFLFSPASATVDFGSVLEEQNEGKFRIGLHCYEEDTVAYCETESDCFGFQKNDLIFFARNDSVTDGVSFGTRLINRTGSACSAKCIIIKEYIRELVTCNIREQVRLRELFKEMLNDADSEKQEKKGKRLFLH